SRRKIFEKEFSEALALADRVVLAGVNQPEKVPEEERLSVKKVVDEVNRLDGRDRALLIEESEDIAPYVAQNSASGDVVLVMSNGSFNGVPEKILRALD